MYKKYQSRQDVLPELSLALTRLWQQAIKEG
jgi:hypothetical protein